MEKKGCGLGAIVFGVILFIACTFFLFQNEGRAVKRARALEEIVNAVEVDSNNTSIDDNTMILVAETAIGNDKLFDEEFGVFAPTASIRLNKDVEMYQWDEDSDTDDGETTYSYNRVWSSSHINSNNFNSTSGHENPSVMAYNSDSYVASKVSLGDYYVGSLFINKMKGSEDLSNLNPSSIDENMSVISNMIFISADGRSTLSSPKIGDYKVSYTYVPSSSYTMLGAKSGTEIIAYETENGDLAEVSSGVLNKEELKKEKDDANKMLTYGLRIGLTVGIIIANMLTISPVTNILGHIPLAGNLFNKGLGLVGSILGIAWSLLVIAAGWFAYRPIVSIILFGIIIALIVLLIFSKRKKEVTV